MSHPLLHSAISSSPVIAGFNSGLRDTNPPRVRLQRRPAVEVTEVLEAICGDRRPFGGQNARTANLRTGDQASSAPSRPPNPPNGVYFRKRRAEPRLRGCWFRGAAWRNQKNELKSARTSHHTGRLEKKWRSNGNRFFDTIVRSPVPSPNKTTNPEKTHISNACCNKKLMNGVLLSVQTAPGLPPLNNWSCL